MIIAALCATTILVALLITNRKRLLARLENTTKRSIDKPTDERTALTFDLICASLKVGAGFTSSLNIAEVMYPEQREDFDSAWERYLAGKTLQEVWDPEHFGPKISHLTTGLHSVFATPVACTQALERHCEDAREHYFHYHQQHAHKLPIRIVLPITLCLLPGFVLLGLAPLMADFFTHLP